MSSMDLGTKHVAPQFGSRQDQDKESEWGGMK